LEKLKDLKEEVDATEKQLASAASPEVYAQLEDITRKPKKITTSSDGPLVEGLLGSGAMGFWRLPTPCLLAAQVSLLL
ncbi:MAG: hypothetical protein BRC45_06100, partial [Cyanobacteria bacterium QS_5_48_63]